MGEPEKRNKVIFHYEKVNDFKTIFASGVFGGLNIAGLIDMNFYIDRPVIPQKISHDLAEKDGGFILSNEKREGKDGEVREVQVGVLIDIPTAKSLIEWLNQKIAEMESLGK